MNRHGALDVNARPAPVLASLHGEPWTLKGVKVLDVRTEIAAAVGDALVPPSLRPGIPAYGSIAVSRVAESPVGPFGLAELRVGVRVGPMASFVLAGVVCDSEAARKVLAERWGFPVVAGEVSLVELYHEVAAQVIVDGRTALRMRLTHRRPLPGTRLNLSSLVSLARDGADGPLILLNTPVQMAYDPVDGGRQEIEAFDGAIFGAGDAFRPTFPMSAAFGTAEITLGSPDCSIDPLVPAEDSLKPIPALS